MNTKLQSKVRKEAKEKEKKRREKQTEKQTKKNEQVSRKQINKYLGKKLSLIPSQQISTFPLLIFSFINAFHDRQDPMHVFDEQTKEFE